jgi:hypothetical protein
MSEVTDDFLQHYGVVGMKWGKRRGSLKERVNSAQIERSQNAQKIIKRKLNGKSTLEEKILFAPDRLLMGKKRHDKFLNKRLSELEARDERIASGKRNLGDKLDAAMNTTLFNLAVSRKDNKG